MILFGVAVFTIISIVVILVTCYAYRNIQERISFLSSQQDDIWNISGRVNQGQSLPPNRWPTHDHHIAVESFVISDRVAKSVPPPPPYSEVDLPSYEEATGCSGKNDIAPVHSTPQTSTSTR
ncbi:uncharacterized protein LOC108742434 [Agrilus planipennis]|uniref:Uncharacterized protein LOC108742434 n=1 Tax=Agrilus planipennis TaxID=224129 RepID=A0A7F5RN30_AGRPL|nr:uncharacterized protein LOC108742434 [Agrilus planipennis]